MALPEKPPAEVSERTWQVSIALRPGSCTIVDWISAAAATTADDSGNAKSEDAVRHSDEHSDSEGSADEEGGYISNSNAVPPAIANDPFFARLLKNAEIYEENEKKNNAKKRASRRRAKDTADDNYDLDDPFIDDSELTVMDSHNLSKQQRKKRRRKADGNTTETEGQGVGGTAVDGSSTNGITVASIDKNVAKQTGTDTGIASTSDGENLLGNVIADDLDKYEEGDFFVYYGPLNELESGNEEEQFEKSDKKPRSRKRPDKKQADKEVAPAKRKPNGTTGSKGEVTDASTSKKKVDTKTQHRRSSSESGAAINLAQVPSNGRKAGARTSRKLDTSRTTSMIDSSTYTAADNASGAEDDYKKQRPPIPEHDRVAALGASSANYVSESEKGASSTMLGTHAITASKHQSKRGGTPSASGSAMSSTAIAPEDASAINEAKKATPEIEAALEELAQATKDEAFENRQRFPSSLKPPLRQVCELSMARALEYDRSVLSLRTPEHKIFAWSTPLDIVGFTTGIYHSLSAILPYNRATVRKIVSKLLGNDLLTWKERQLKQIEDGLKVRIDEQIERGMGWIPVGARTGTKESEDGASGGAQVRWHWTTISKHILYQYMILSLNVNELRSHLDPSAGKDGAYREQQARKDAYAHLVNLWPGSTMVTYEISRAYSSRKSLVEKQSKKVDSAPTQVKVEASETTPVPATQLEYSNDAGASSQLQHTPEIPMAAPIQSVQGTPIPSRFDAEFVSPTHSMSPYSHSQPPQPHQHILMQQQIPSPTRNEYMHASQGCDGYNQSPVPHMQLYEGNTAGIVPALQQDSQQLSPHASHRNLGFDRQSDPFAAPRDYSHHTNGVYTSYFSNGQADMQQSQGQQSQPHQPPNRHHHHQMSSGGAGSAGNEDEYGSPGSGRYSMSVHNLTSP
ncbi:hypothetical protein GGI25_005438 [Coemansia spiralis]|uniref:Uncharacterized protein n=2 Tax=Coemansia TaxID=4863 RepID=A0A9W8KW98_9FUNG|nr:hypothetical protein EDC05_005405 [Coemansia umbellata]KAJ2619594.1 hypothetical protein GGI26_005701 [Coemansia sp. RSA 1358]KAJ2671621.1 hypothetical protein GGI25_005438 [Coemansia spiralis]